MMKGERGFTLAELLVATAITGLVISGLGTAIYQILTVTDYGYDRLKAAHELQNVAHWFSLDGQMASAASGGNKLVLTLSDGSLVTYTLLDTELHRVAGGSNMTLARDITGANFLVRNRTVTMSLTSSPESRWDVSENGTYRVYLRPTKVPKEIIPIEVTPGPIDVIRGQ
jgi:prepilin-type N-terminal cleavage/methylation domain-containing protein